MEDQVRVTLRSVEGCGSNGQKLDDCFRGDLYSLRVLSI